MSREPQKPTYPVHLQVNEWERLRHSPAEADDAVVLPEITPDATPQPNDATSADDRIEAGFDNMPV